MDFAVIVLLAPRTNTVCKRQYTVGKKFLTTGGVYCYVDANLVFLFIGSQPPKLWTYIPMNSDEYAAGISLPALTRDSLYLQLLRGE